MHLETELYLQKLYLQKLYLQKRVANLFFGTASTTVFFVIKMLMLHLPIAVFQFDPTKDLDDYRKVINEKLVEYKQSIQPYQLDNEKLEQVLASIQAQARFQSSLLGQRYAYHEISGKRHYFNDVQFQVVTQLTR